MTDRTTTIDDSPTARLAHKRRLAAERARRSRRRRAEARIPSAREAESAIVEAISFLLARDGVLPLRDPQVLLRARLSVTELLDTAARLLIDREGSDKAQGIRVMLARLRPRAKHQDPYAALTRTPGPDHERLVRVPQTA